MEKKYTFERYYWIENRIKIGRFPKRKDIAYHFEITERQVSRDINFMKEHLNVPIKYCEEKGGYIYTDDSFELPKPKVTEHELISFVIAECLADSIPTRQMLKDIDSFIQKLSKTAGIDLDSVKKKVSIKNIRYDRVSPNVFERILQALNANHKLKVEYKSKYGGKITNRVVRPLHLLLYMGNWHLYAFCETRNSYRTFALSGIRNLEILNDFIDDDFNCGDIRKLIDESYGIFINDNDANKIEVVLKFDEVVADRIRKQVWVSSQQMEEMENGSVLLRLFVTDFTELTEEILRHGQHVEVLHPPELRDEIKMVISQMSSLYL